MFYHILLLLISMIHIKKYILWHSFEIVTFFDVIFKTIKQSHKKMHKWKAVANNKSCINILQLKNIKLFCYVFYIYFILF